MGKFAKTFIADALIIAGIIFPPIAPFTYTLAANLLLSQLQGLLFAPDLPDRTNFIQRMLADPQAGLPIIYGTAKVGMRLIDVRVDRNSGQWVDLYVVGAWCHGSQAGAPNNGQISGLTDIFFDQYLALPDPRTECSTKYRKGTAHFLYDLGDHLGSTTQTTNTFLAAAFPSIWTAAHRGRGVAYTVLKLIYSVDIYQGMPGDIMATVKGAVVWDVRDSTWKWSDNPALCIYDFLTSPVYGMGIAAGEIDAPSFQACANYCDEIVGTWGVGAQKRFTCNGALDSARSPKENLGILLTSCRGNLVYEGGKYRLLIRRPLTQATLTLDRSNIVGDWSYVVGGTKESYNVVRARYVDKDRDWSVQMQQFPEPGVANGYLTDDNNWENPLDLDLPFTNNKWTAQQIGMVALRESRAGLGVQVTCTEAALQLQVGDIVPLTHETPGWVAKLFWVLALAVTSDNLVRVTLAEYQASAYSLDLTTDKPTNPGTDLPDPFATVSPPTGLTLLSNAATTMQSSDGTIIPRIRASWALPNQLYMDYVEIWARQVPYAGGPWTFMMRVDVREDQLCYIPAIIEGAAWLVQARVVNTVGKASDWVSAQVTVDSVFNENNLPLYGGRHDWILNGLFEEGGLAFWKAWVSGAATVTLDTGSAYAGSHCLKLHTDGGAGARAVQALSIGPKPFAGYPDPEMCLFRVRPGDRVRVRAAVRLGSAGANNHIYVGFVLFNADRQQILATIFPKVGWNHTSTSWGVYEETFEIPANLSGQAAYFVAPSVEIFTAGVAYDGFVDDIHIWRQIDANDLAPVVYKGLSQPDGNLIYNPSFEEGGALWSDATGATVVNDNTKARSGNQYLAIQGTAGVSRLVVHADPKTGAPRIFEVNAGDLIQIAGYGYRESGDQECRIWLSFLDKDGFNESGWSGPQFTAAAWTQGNAYVTVPAGKKYAKVSLEVKGGTVASLCRFDDIRLAPLIGLFDMMPTVVNALAVPGLNSLYNPGLEDGLAFWGGPGVSAPTDSSKAHSGNRYLQVQGSAGSIIDGYHWDDRGNVRFIEVNPGDVLRVSGWLYRESGDQLAGFGIGIYDKDKANPAWFGVSPTMSSSVWIFGSATIVVPPGGKYVMFFAQTTGGTVSSVIRFDDMALEINPARSRLLFSGRGSGITTAAPLSFTVPAGTLAVDGQALRVKISGHGVSGTTNMTLTFDGNSCGSEAVSVNDIFDLTFIIRRVPGGASVDYQSTFLLQNEAYQLNAGNFAINLAANKVLSFYTTGTVTCVVDHMDVDLLDA